MGASMNSQKKKNRNRSVARNTPMMPVITHIMQKWKNPTACSIFFQDATSARIPTVSVRMQRM